MRLRLVVVLLIAGGGALLACSSGGSSGSGSAGSGGSGGSSGGGGQGGSAGSVAGSGGLAGGDAGGAGGAGGGGGTAGQPGCDPGAADAVGDGIDQNCDGVDGVDADGDGVASEASGGTDCNDGDTSVFPGASESWKLELVMLGPPPSSLAVDGTGALHLAFVTSGSDSGPAYATNASGTWTFESITKADASAPQVAIGAGGDRHVTWVQDALATRVRLSSAAPSGTWSTQSIGSLTDMKIQPRVATDAAGTVHLIATDENQPAGGGAAQPSDLYYANEAFGFAVAEVLLPGTERIVGPALAVSAAGIPHVSWHDDGTTTVYGPADPRTRYVQIDPGASIHGGVVTIDDAGTHGATFITLDASGEPAVSYWRSEPGNMVGLRVARRSGSSWSYETVLTAAASRPAPIAFGAGTFHLCSVDAGTLQYLTRSGAGSWPIETIVSGAEASCQIVFDPSGQTPHVTYGANGRIWHAHPEPSPGVDRDCDGSDD